MSSNVTIQLTLNKEALEAATAARIRRGLDVPSNFEGPTFENVQKYDTIDGFFCILTADGVQYGYNVNTIARFKVTVKEQA